MAKLKIYEFDTEEAEAFLDAMGYNWEDHYNDYEEFYNDVQETLKESFSHCKK